MPANLVDPTLALPASWWAVALSPALAALLTLALIGPARRCGLVDHPGGRKQHAAPTPLVGGVAIFLTFLIVNWLLDGLPGGSWSLLFAMTMTVAIGVADDAHEIGHRAKFVVQVLAALVIVSGTAVHVTHFGNLLGLGELALGKWSYLVTVIAIIGVMNAINMIDGVDGLAGTIVLMPLLILAGVAVNSGDVRLGVEILALAGAVAGFLVFNLRSPWRPRALIFLGDTGGLLLGLLLAWYSIKLAGSEESAIRPITAVWILAAPLLDMGSVMLLRLTQRKSPFHADRQHMHYVLLDAGCSASQVVAINALASLAQAFIGLTALSLGVAESIMFLAFLCLWGAYLLALAKPHLVGQLARRLCVRPQTAADPARR